MSVARLKYLPVVCSLLFVLLANRISAQSIEQVVSFGDSLFSLCKFDAALNEYQRAYFFSIPTGRQSLGIKIGNCCLAKMDMKQACAFYDSAYFYSNTDSSRLACSFNKIACYILESSFGYALLKLEELDTDSCDYFRSKKKLYQAISYFGLERYDEAFLLFDDVLDHSDSIKVLRFEKLLENRQKLERPNPTLATFMSIGIPGSGQFYAGQFYAGLNSILLLSSLTLLGYYVPELAFVVAPFLYRYYIVGILRANQFAKAKKRFRKQTIYIDLFTLFPDTPFRAPVFQNVKTGNHYQHYFENSISETKILLSLSFLAYKQFFSSQDVGACVFSPSCSVYMLETVNTNGSFIGYLDGIDRLLRCHYFVNEHHYSYNIITDKYDDAP